MRFGKRKPENSLSLEDYLKLFPNTRKYKRKRHAKSRRYLKKELKQLFPDEEKEAMEQTLETIQKVKRYLPESQTSVLEQTIKEIQRLLNKDENEDGTDSDEEITDDFNKENKDLDEQLKEYVAYKVIPPLIEDAKEAYNKKEYEKADKIIAEIDRYRDKTDLAFLRDLIMLKKEVLGSLSVEYMIEKFRNHTQQIGELAEDMITQGSKAVRRAYNLGHYDHVVYVMRHIKEVAKSTNQSLPKDIKKIYRVSKRKVRRMGSENFEDPWKIKDRKLYVG
jgi:hypothetical protein